MARYCVVQGQGLEPTGKQATHYQIADDRIHVTCVEAASPIDAIDKINPKLLTFFDTRLTTWKDINGISGALKKTSKPEVASVLLDHLKKTDVGWPKPAEQSEATAVMFNRVSADIFVVYKVEP